MMVKDLSAVAVETGIVGSVRSALNNIAGHNSALVDLELLPALLAGPATPVGTTEFSSGEFSRGYH